MGCAKPNALFECRLRPESENGREQEVRNEANGIANGICNTYIHRLLQHEIEQIVNCRGYNTNNGKTYKFSNGLLRGNTSDVGQ